MPLNVVRAGVCARPEHWRWGSYRATIGLETPPPFLSLKWLLDHFGPDPVKARERYRAFVEARLDPPRLP